MTIRWWLLHLFYEYLFNLLMEIHKIFFLNYQILSMYPNTNLFKLIRSMFHYQFFLLSIQQSNLINKNQKNYHLKK